MAKPNIKIISIVSLGIAPKTLIEPLIDSCALTFCFVASVLGPVSCFFGVRKCIDHGQEEHMNDTPQIPFIPTQQWKCEPVRIENVTDRAHQQPLNASRSRSQNEVIHAPKR